MSIQDLAEKLFVKWAEPNSNYDLLRMQAHVAARVFTQDYNTSVPTVAPTSPKESDNPIKAVMVLGPVSPYWAVPGMVYRVSKWSYDNKCPYILSSDGFVRLCDNGAVDHTVYPLWEPASEDSAGQRFPVVDSNHPIAHLAWDLFKHLGCDVNPLYFWNRLPKEGYRNWTDQAVKLSKLTEKPSRE